MSSGVGENFRLCCGRSVPLMQASRTDFNFDLYFTVSTSSVSFRLLRLNSQAPLILILSSRIQQVPVGVLGFTVLFSGTHRRARVVNLNWSFFWGLGFSPPAYFGRGSLAFFKSYHESLKCIVSSCVTFWRGWSIFDWPLTINRKWGTGFWGGATRCPSQVIRDRLSGA